MYCIMYLTMYHVLLIAECKWSHGSTVTFIHSCGFHLGLGHSKVWTDTLNINTVKYQKLICLPVFHLSSDLLPHFFLTKYHGTLGIAKKWLLRAMGSNLDLVLSSGKPFCMFTFDHITNNIPSNLQQIVLPSYGLRLIRWRTYCPQCDLILEFFY